MSNRELVLEAENIYKHFESDGQTLEVLKGVNISIRQGESVALMGPSGAGKSTLLNILGTLDPPSQGTVFFRGDDVYQMDEATTSKVRNSRIGFVFQFHNLLPEFDALENTMMPALISGRNKRMAIEMATAMLNQVGLKDRLRHRIGELSGGEQQRVAIARALIMNPDLLLADEPTGNLDKSTGEEITKLMLRLNKTRGLALIVATHNEMLAREMSKKLLLIDGSFA